MNENQFLEGIERKRAFFIAALMVELYCLEKEKGSGLFSKPAEPYIIPTALSIGVVGRCAAAKLEELGLAIAPPLTPSLRARFKASRALFFNLVFTLSLHPLTLFSCLHRASDVHLNIWGRIYLVERVMRDNNLRAGAFHSGARQHLCSAPGSGVDAIRGIPCARLDYGCRAHGASHRGGAVIDRWWSRHARWLRGLLESFDDHHGNQSSFDSIDARVASTYVRDLLIIERWKAGSTLDKESNHPYCHPTRRFSFHRCCPRCRLSDTTATAAEW